MKYYVLNGASQPDRPQGEAFERVLEAHHAYMQAALVKGDILVMGPKPNHKGGVILVRCEDLDAAEAFCAGDPFVKAGVQKYEIIEFNIFGIQEGAKTWKR